MCDCEGDKIAFFTFLYIRIELRKHYGKNKSEGKLKVIKTKIKNATCIFDVPEPVGSRPSYINRVSNLPSGLSILCSINFRRDFYGQSKWKIDGIF